MSERLYTCKEAAVMLGVKPCTIRDRAKQGKIGYVRDGRRGHFRFRQADLDAYVAANYLAARQ